MNRAIVIVCSLVMLSSSALADRDSEEFRLLKSWGMQFDAQGHLRFSPKLQRAARFQPWTPDLSAYKSIHSPRSVRESLQPLVISSRQRAIEEEAEKSER